MAEAMQQEMKPFGIQIQTINPGAFMAAINPRTRNHDFTVQ